MSKKKNEKNVIDKIFSWGNSKLQTKFNNPDSVGADERGPNRTLQGKSSIFGSVLGKNTKKNKRSKE